MIIEQLLLPMGQETKAEAEPPGPVWSSVPFANGPLSPWVQQGATWCHFYEMLCFPDPKCLSVAERRGCIHTAQASLGRRMKLFLMEPRSSSPDC